MVEHQPSKLDTWVRFPSPALFFCPSAGCVGDANRTCGSVSASLRSVPSRCHRHLAPHHPLYFFALLQGVPVMRIEPAVRSPLRFGRCQTGATGTWHPITRSIFCHFADFTFHKRTFPRLWEGSFCHIMQAFIRSAHLKKLRFFRCRAVALSAEK